ncbi:MAG: hypothetical protein ACKOC9_14260, partial [Alphaproteobacteria bacterium]
MRLIIALLLGLASPGFAQVAGMNAGPDPRLPVPAGNAEAGFTQSDVSHWAFTATGLFEGRPKTDRIRFVGHLFPEHIHA